VKILETVTLIDTGNFSSTQEFKRIREEIERGIQTIENPIGSGKFILNPVKKGNGVTTIKVPCMKYLESKGWELEVRMDLATNIQPGPLDAIRQLPSQPPFVFEWETGNISSSHRALNKMAVGLIEKKISGGILVVPSGNMYPWLTDRIGNVEELKPYFPIFSNLKVDRGYYGIIVIEQDELSSNAPLLEKGTDGRSKKKRLPKKKTKKRKKDK